jgi:hypothetical protein
MLVFKQKSQGRKKLSAAGQQSQASSNLHSNENRKKEPWLLATLLITKTTGDAKKLVKI